MHRPQTRSTLGVLAIGLLALVLGAGRAADPPPGSTATLHVVSSPRDGGTGSLRAAIDRAHRGDTIALDPELAGLVIELELGQLVIDRDLIIEAPDGGVTIAGGGRSRIFLVEPGASLTLRNLVLTEGSARDGGAILNHGTLALIDSTVTGSSSRRGGGISNHGTLLLERSTIEGNESYPVRGPGNRFALLDNSGGLLEGARDGPNITHGALAIFATADGRVHVSGELPQERSYDSTHHVVLREDGALAGGQSRDGYIVALLADGATLSRHTDSVLPGVRIVRHDGDGNLDGAFSLQLDGPWYLEVSDLLEQPDGKLIVSGSFDGVNGKVRTGVVRLHVDGRIDDDFVADVPSRSARLALQADGKVIVATESRLLRLDGDGREDPTFAPDPDAVGELDDVLKVAVLADGRIVVATPRSIIRLKPDGSRDEGFAPTLSLVAELWMRWHGVTPLPDGGMLVVGQFGFAQEVVRGGILRLMPDGTVDPGFDAGTGANAEVYAAVVQRDGKILIGGAFSRVDGRPRNLVARLHADGRLDDSFEPAITAPSDVLGYTRYIDDTFLVAGSDGRGSFLYCQSSYGPSPCSRFADFGPNGTVHAVVGPIDGPYVIGGAFTAVHGTTRNHVARIAASGHVDPQFDPGTGPDGPVHTVTVLRDGKILIGGEFAEVDGAARPFLARLREDGSADRAFGAGAGPDGPVRASLELDDGRILIGGDFSNVDGVPARGVARLHEDGTLDRGFDPGGGADGSVLALALEPDGSVLIGGAFTSIGGTARVRIARLRADGTLDHAFDPGLGPNGSVRIIEAHEDGTIWIAGDFTSVDQMLHVGTGGGIFNDGALHLRESIVTRNTADVAGGGVYAPSPFTSESSMLAGNEARRFPEEEADRAR